ncbi:MAG: DUF861 domain-containing protein [Candidatus Omnitrophica bacterium]|nr:DUF861 domain-containing protein [Candidatus Omnitrophota bacterium]MBU4477849.1 DUF861 domain-containing protein [Candidatus Omnitrophota bacterium]MCG2703477.1 cupin domain-containing protein [Candidatus Omnitrophota bacterium]
MEKLGIKGWSTWECSVSKFDWTYAEKETAYLYEGKVRVKSIP